MTSDDARWQPVQSSFNAQSWNEAQRCLNDVVDGDSRDAAIRLNQIFAVSLAYSMPSRERTRQVGGAVEDVSCVKPSRRELAIAK